MESFEDSHCTSMSNSFSLYERYMRSFNVVDNFEISHREASKPFNCEYENSNSADNINTSTKQTNFYKHSNLALNRAECSTVEPLNDSDVRGLDGDLPKIESPSTSSLLETLSTTDHCIQEKSELTDIRVFSEESISRDSKPVFITATMENSNNAVDSVPMFSDVKQTENVFKLPISELTFNASILKHVQKLTPIVDPITALSSGSNILNLNEDQCTNMSASNDTVQSTGLNSSDSDERSRTSTNEKISESSDNSYYQEFNLRKESNEGNSRWNADQSFSSLDGSFDSGVRSPDMFSDGDEDKEPNPSPEPFWDFIKTYETCDKRKVRKIEETLQGILPPPSITTLKTDVTQLLKKYYSFLPHFNGEENVNMETNSITPTKKVSFINIPTSDNCQASTSILNKVNSTKTCTEVKDNENTEYDPNNSLNDKSIEIKMSSKSEVLQTSWPDILKCKYYDVYYNVTSYSEKLERLMQKYAERFVGAETDTSVNIHSGGLQSPSSASKRKALRLRMAQAKSPGRRLSHLARRRQAFCSAATISEKAQCSTSKMVLIDKNFFPHRKLVNSSERKSPRLRRTPGKKTPTSKTPGKKTPGRKTPGKKTPAKTPKANGGSSRKKAMRRLLMDTEALSKSQPTREPLKRALFVSPENRKAVPIPTCSSVPHQAMKSKRALFGSPVRAEETKSLDGSLSDQFLKRKRDVFDDEPQTSRSKIAKSLSFGGDRISSSIQPMTFNRRASEMLSTKTMAELNETHKKKLLWAVTEALRLHGWRMSSPGFREKASALARLTRRLLTLPPHAARLASPQLSTSDTMFKLARQYVFAIIQGRTVDECFQDEQVKLSNEPNKISGYISASAYQQMKAKQVPLTSQIKENTFTNQIKTDQMRSSTKNILQDKMVNIDSNSNSSSGFSTLEKAGVFKSNSMPSFEEAAKMRARRQISFDNMDFPKR